MKKVVSLLLLIVFIFLIFFALRGILFIPGTVGRNWDWFFPVLPKFLQSMFLRYLYVWNETINLGEAIFGQSALSTNVFFSSLSFLGLGGDFNSKFSLVITFFISGISMYKLIKFVFKDTEEKISFGAALLSGFMYAFSPFLFNDMIGGAVTQYFTYSLLPLCLYFFLKTLSNNQLSDIIFTSILLWVISSSFQNFLFISFIFFTYFLTFSFSFSNLRKLVITYILFILISIYWLLPLFSLTKDISEQALSKNVSWSLGGLYSSSTKLLYSLFSNGYKDRDLFLNSLPYFLQWLYLTGLVIIFSFVGLVFFQLMPKLKLSSLKKKQFIYWFGIFLVAVLFAKGLREPFPYIISLIYQNVKLFNVFRSNQHFLTLTTFSFVMVFSYANLVFYEWIRYKGLKISGYFFFIAEVFLIVVGYNLSYWVTSDLGMMELYRKGKDHIDVYQLSPELTNIYNFLSAQKGVFRLANLPLSISPRYLKKDYQLDGQSSDTEMASSPFPIYSADLPKKKTIISNIETSFLNCNINILDTLLNFTNTRFILIKRDRLPEFNAFRDLYDYDKLYKCLLSDNNLKLVSATNDFQLFERRNESFMQKIVGSSGEINNFVMFSKPFYGISGEDWDNFKSKILYSDLIPNFSLNKINPFFTLSDKISPYNNVFVVYPELMKYEDNNLYLPVEDLVRTTSADIKFPNLYIYKHNKQLSVETQNAPGGINLKFILPISYGDLLVNNKAIDLENKDESELVYKLNINGLDKNNLFLYNNGDIYRIGRNFTDSGKLFNIDLSDFTPDQFGIFKSGDSKEVFSETFEKGFNDWQKGDCTGADPEKQYTSINLIKDPSDNKYSAEIASKGHTACLNRSLPKLDIGSYLVTFDYKNVEGGNPIFALIADGKGNLNSKRLEKDIGNWHTFENIVNIRKPSNLIQFYFYSETSGIQDNIVVTLLKNIKVVKLQEINLSPKFYQTISGFKDNPWALVDEFIPKDGDVKKISLALDQSENLVQNNSFEKPKLWPYGDCSGPPSPFYPVKTYQVDDAIDGAKSLELYSKTHAVCTNYSMYDLDMSGTYYLSFDYKNITGGNIDFAIVENGRANYTYHLPASQKWQKFSTVYIPKSNPKSVQLYFYNTNTVDQVTVNRINNVVFRKILDRESRYLVSTQKFDFQKQKNSSGPVISFRRINPTKFKVIAQGVTSSFMLEFNESFHNEWKAYVESPNNGLSMTRKLFSSPIWAKTDGRVIIATSSSLLSASVSSSLIAGMNNNIEVIDLSKTSSPSSYLSEEEDSQLLSLTGAKKPIGFNVDEMRATPSDVAEYVNEGLLGRFTGGDYISKNINGSIQNDNIPAGPVYKTWLASQDDSTLIPGWLQNKNVYKIPDKDHLMAYGFANSWWIDVNSLADRGFIKKNPDGTYSMEMTLEFWPQRMFYIGGVISGIILFGSLVYLLYIYYLSISTYFRKLYSLHYWKTAGEEIIHTVKSVKEVYKDLMSTKHDRLNHRILVPVALVSKKISRMISDSMRKREVENKRREMLLEGMMIPRQVVMSDSGNKLESELEKIRLEQELTRVRMEKELMEVKLGNENKGRVKDKKHEFFDMEIAEENDYSDISKESVKVYREKYEKANGRPLHVEDDRELLRELGCLTKEGKPTVAGILLFGKNTQKFFLKSYITVVRYKDIEIGAHDSKDFKGTLFEIVDKVIEYLEEHTQVIRKINDKQLEREDIPIYPYFALREALINAVVHRDYSIGGSRIIISIYPDKIEFMSPGDFPIGITPETVLRAQYSRNPIISRVFYDVKYIEQFGSGIDRIFTVFKKHPLKPPQPTIEVVNDNVIITFYKPKLSDE